MGVQPPGPWGPGSHSQLFPAPTRQEATGTQWISNTEMETVQGLRGRVKWSRGPLNRQKESLSSPVFFFFFLLSFCFVWASLIPQLVKNPPAVPESLV